MQCNKNKEPYELQINSHRNSINFMISSNDLSGFRIILESNKIVNIVINFLI